MPELSEVINALAELPESLDDDTVVDNDEQETEETCKSVTVIDVDAHSSGCIRSPRSKAEGTYHANESCAWQLVTSEPLK